MKRTAQLLAVTLALPLALHAQLGRLEKCLPIPSVRQEIDQLRAESAAIQPTFEIANVSFQSTDALPEELRRRVTASITGRTFTDSPDAFLEVSERARAALQESGYFQAQVNASLYLKGPEQKEVEAELYVDVGRQFRLGKLLFKGNRALSTHELEGVFALRPGDIFETSLIRSGLDAMRSAYARKGYVNYTAVPDTHVEDGLVTLEVDIAEDWQFRISEVRVLGIDAGAANASVDAFGLRPGAIFEPEAVKEAFGGLTSAHAIAGEFDEDVSIAFNNENATVAITIDLRTCPQLAGTSDSEDR